MKRLKGKCKKCGNCCRNITFMVGNRYVTNEEEFERMQEFDHKYNNFYVSGVDEDGTLLFTCNALGEDNLCKSYFFRSLYCWLFPWIKRKELKSGAKLLAGCGYFYTD